MAGSILGTGKAKPEIEKLRTDHKAHILIDILSEGKSPNIKIPKA
jgi:hypothetical protein